MLAHSADGAFDSEQHLFEIKWDGTRCLAFIDAAGVRLQNRRYFDMRVRYPELADLARLPHGAVLDAEIVVLEQGRPSFNRLAQRDHLSDPERIALAAARLPATMMAFDLLYLNGQPLLAAPLVERKARLRELVGALNSPHVLAPDHVVGKGVAYFAAAERHGLEGVMAKRLDSAYQCGKRSPHWLKIKSARVGDFDVLGYTPREKGGDFVSALLIGERQERGWIFRGRVGAGFTEELRAELFRRLRGCPELNDPPPGGPRDAVWRMSGLACSVRYFESTPQGMLRGPVLVDLKPAPPG
jgi:ATP-dependent DNA ligase